MLFVYFLWVGEERVQCNFDMVCLLRGQYFKRFESKFGALLPAPNRYCQLQAWAIGRV